MPRKNNTDDILDLLRREDPSFIPPADPAPRSTPAVPSTDPPEHRNRVTLGKRGAPHFWMGERASDPWDEARNKGGRPLKNPVTGEPVYHDVTVWVEGEAFLADRDQPLPTQYIRPDVDPPDVFSVVGLVSYYLRLVTHASWPLTLVLEDIADSLPPMAPGSTRKGWTTKRVKREDVLRFLHEQGSKTTAELTEALFGPFTDSVRRNQASAKIRVHIHRLARDRAIERVLGDHGVVFWHALIEPPVYEAGHPAKLGFTPKPERPWGRVRLAIEGETYIPERDEHRHVEVPNLARVVASVGLHLRITYGEDQDYEPAPAKPPHRDHPFQRRVDQGMAIAVLEAVRLGQFEPPVEEDGRLVYRPMLCYFPYWARMLYRPRTAAPAGGRWDTIFLDAPEPTREEQCYMELKAHRMLRALERRGLVVRRKAPDGRTILFRDRDPEAADWPRAWTRRPSP